MSFGGSVRTIRRRGRRRLVPTLLVVTSTLVVACGTGGDVAVDVAPTAPSAGATAPDASDGTTATDEQGSATSDDAPATTGPARIDGRAPETTTPTGVAPPDISSEFSDHRTRRTRSGQCLGLATGPWTEVPYETDPLNTIRTGAIPGLPDGADHLEFDQLVEFPTVESYRDVSTLRDADAVAAAWAEAGYADGVMAEYLEGGYQYQAAAVRFRDSAAARGALTAHLQDYCHRSVDARLLPAGNGITVLRDLGAVRTLWVQGDVLLSVFICVCYADDDRSRQDLVEQWADEVTAILGAGRRENDTI